MAESNQQHWGSMDGETEDRAGAVFDAADAVAEATEGRAQVVLDSTVLYGGDTAGANGEIYLTEKLPGKRWVSHNIIAVVVDTLIAEVTLDMPRPMALSLDGSLWGFNHAEVTTGWWDYQFERLEVDALLPQFIRDSLVAGLGALRPYVMDGKLYVDRLNPIDILIDDVGMRGSMPRNLYLRSFVDRGYLKECYPEHAEKIEEAESETASSFDLVLGTDTTTTRDDVLVYEAWTLGKRGKHIICCSNTVLFVEDYTDEFFPLVFLRSISPLGGFWGRSPVQRMAPLQTEHNKLMRRVQLGQHLMCTPRVYLQTGSQPSAKSRNGIGDVIYYTGNPPIFDTPSAMPAEVYQHIDRLTQMCFQVAMISEFAAGGTVPAGVTSGKAMRVMREYSSRNFINFERAVERAVCELGRQMLRLAKDLKGDTFFRDLFGDYSITSYADLTRYEPHIKVKPVSALSNTPGAQLEDINDLAERGLLDPKDIIRISTVPDLEFLRRRLLVSERLVDKLYMEMIRDGKPRTPEPYMDLQYAIRRGKEVALEAELREAPQERVQLVRDFFVACQQQIEDAESEMQAKMQEQAQMQAMAAAPPMPPPGAEGLPPELMTGAGPTGAEAPLPPPGTEPAPQPTLA